MVRTGMDSKSELNNRPPNLFLGILERDWERKV